MKHLTNDREIAQARKDKALQSKKASGEKQHEHEITQRAKLVERDRQSCMALAYKPGTTCFCFSTRGSHDYRYFGRKCKILKVLDMKPIWANIDEKVLAWGGNNLWSRAFIPGEIEYRIKFLVLTPFLDGTHEETVMDIDLISLEEVEQGGGYQQEKFSPVLKPARCFNRVAVYDSEIVNDGRPPAPGSPNLGCGF